MLRRSIRPEVSLRSARPRGLAWLGQSPAAWAVDRGERFVSARLVRRPPTCPPDPAALGGALRLGRWILCGLAAAPRRRAVPAAARGDEPSARVRRRGVGGLRGARAGPDAARGRHGLRRAPPGLHVLEPELGDERCDDGRPSPMDSGADGIQELGAGGISDGGAMGREEPPAGQRPSADASAAVTRCSRCAVALGPACGRAGVRRRARSAGAAGRALSSSACELNESEGGSTPGRPARGPGSRRIRSRREGARRLRPSAPPRRGARRPGEAGERAMPRRISRRPSPPSGVTTACSSEASPPRRTHPAGAPRADRRGVQLLAGRFRSASVSPRLRAAGAGAARRSVSPAGSSRRWMSAPEHVVSASSTSSTSLDSSAPLRAAPAALARLGSLDGLPPASVRGAGTPREDRGSPLSDADCLLFARHVLQTTARDGRISRPTPIST